MGMNSILLSILVGSLIFASLGTMGSMGLDIATRSAESTLEVEAGSNFYLTIPLINPENQVSGSYAIVSDAELKSSVDNALSGSGFQIDWANKKIGYIVRSDEMLRRSWDDQMGKLFNAIDAANLGFNLISGEPPSPTDIATIFTGTPVDWTLDLGDKYRDTMLQTNSKNFETCMKSGNQFPISGTLNTRSIRDGILIPPTTEILIQIPLSAPSQETELQINLNIPYYYTSYMTWAPAGCAGIKVTSNQVTWKKIISVKKQPNEALEGSWEGTYYYSDGRAPVKFSATITQNGNEFSGRIQEPNTFGDPSAPLLFANIEGSVTGDSITFVKTYDGTGNVHHSVDYRGTLDINTKKITGTWTINSSNGVTSGTFDMSFV